MENKEKRISLTKDVLRDFLQQTPLYKKVFVESIRSLPDLVPDEIEIECDSIKCRKEQIYRDYDSKARLNNEILEHNARLGDSPNIAGISSIRTITTPRMIYRFCYYCIACRDSFFNCWVELNAFPLDPPNYYIWKVGQLPPYNIAISKELAKCIGDDADLYKRATILTSQGFGIGACIYLRRILENRINPLLDIMLQKRKEEKAQEGEIEAITKAIKSIAFVDKIDILKKDLSKITIPEGTNPILLMYDTLSDGIHRRDDNHCVDVAQMVSSLFVGIIINLQKEMETRKQYSSDIAKLSSVRNRNM